MASNRPNHDGWRRSRGRARGIRSAAILVALVGSAACQSKGDGGDVGGAGGVVVVNAPAAGVVRRVLVREGMTINEGTPVVEIAVATQARVALPTEGEDPLARAGRNIHAAQAEIEAARSEVVRTEVEVQRLTPLIASGAAPQGQLDGARAEYERAQQRFQRAQSSAQGAQSGLVVAREQSRPAAPVATATPAERIVEARASSAGTVSVVSARVGERVTAGQPLATLRSGRP